MIGAALAAWILLAWRYEPKDRRGFVLVVSVVVFLYATVAGTLVTCDCLSEEKREGTLGLLFLTDLKGHDVVLGKLAATSVNAFYGMLAVLPMLAIPFILGGVTRAEMLRVVLVSINLCFSFSASACSSPPSAARTTGRLGSSIFIGLALVLEPDRSWSNSNSSRPQVSSQLALESCPAVGCFLAFDENYTTLPHSISGSMPQRHNCTVGFFSDWPAGSCLARGRTRRLERKCLGSARSPLLGATVREDPLAGRQSLFVARGPVRPQAVARLVDTACAYSAVVALRPVGSPGGLFGARCGFAPARACGLDL
jgi:hypothetical protein